MISIIAAVAKNNVIGNGNKLPWGDIRNMPDDKKRFQELTLGKTVLMGRNTYESIFVDLGRKMPNRKKVVVSKESINIPPELKKEFKTFNDLDKALEAHKNEDLFIIGGASIYNQTLDKADKLYITWIDQEPEGDVFFPKISTKDWTLKAEEIHPGYRFAVYEKSN